MKLAIYSRKSIFTGKGESIENQIQMCKQYIISKIDKDAEIYIYEDEGYSGGNTNRPKFQELIKDIKAGRIDRIVCYKLDRIGRSVAQLSNLFELLDKYNCSFTSITEQQFDTTTPMGRAMINIASTFAQLERETIAERVRDNMIELSKSGRWLGGQSPLGFSPQKCIYIDEELKQRTLMKLTPINSELELVKLIFASYTKEESINQTAKKLNLKEVKGKNGGNFNTSQLIRILKNPIYIISDENSHQYLKECGMNVFGTPNGNGYLTYNKTRKLTIERNVSQWIAAVSKHKGIISSSDWIKVQNILAKNKDKKIIRLGTGSSNSSLLSGILKCAKCGANMIIKHGHKSAETKIRYDYYVCSNKEHKYVDKCTNPNVRVDKLDKMVISKLKAYDKNILLKSLEEILAKNSSKTEADSAQNIAEKIDLKKHQSSNLVRTLSNAPDDDTAQIIMNEISQINQEIKFLENSLLNINTEKDNLSIKTDNIELIMDALNNFNENIDIIKDVKQKRLLLQCITNKILWDGESYTAQIEIALKNDDSSKDI